MVQIENIPFDPPGGEGSNGSCKRPIDLTHLSRQTLGDRELEQEILSMFCHQSAELFDMMAKVNGDERKRIAHRLKGAARSVGAFRVADTAAAIEANPQSTSSVRKMARLVDEVRDFINSICR